MDPNELTAFVATITVLISKSLPNDDDLAMFAIAIDLLSDNVSAVLAQRALMKNKGIVPLPVQDDENLL